MVPPVNPSQGHDQTNGPPPNTFGYDQNLEMTNALHYNYPNPNGNGMANN